MGVSDEGVKHGGCGCPYLGPDLLGGGPVIHDLQIGDMGNDPLHSKGVGQIPPQGGPQADGEKNLENKVHHMGILPAGGRDSGDGNAGGGYPRILLPE